MLSLLLNIAFQLYASNVVPDMIAGYERYEIHYYAKARITQDIIEEVQTFSPKPKSNTQIAKLTYNPYDVTHLADNADKLFDEESFEEILPGQENLSDDDDSEISEYSRTLRMIYEDELYGAANTDTAPSNNMTTNNAQQNGAVLGDRIVSPEDYHPPPGTSTPTPTQSTASNTGGISNAPTQNYLLQINKIGLSNVPITPTNIYDEADWFDDLKRGVGNFLETPGKGHKVGIFGHSSNYNWVDSAYNYVFKDLNNLQIGDLVHIDHSGKRYAYKVVKKEITGPQVPSVITDYGREELVMFTCWPYLTSKNRLIVYAEPMF